MGGNREVVFHEVRWVIDDNRTQTVAIARMLPAKEGCTCIIGCNCVLTNATHMAKVRISIVYAQLGETNA